MLYLGSAIRAGELKFDRTFKEQQIHVVTGNGRIGTVDELTMLSDGTMRVWLRHLNGESFKVLYDADDLQLLEREYDEDDCPDDCVCRGGER